VLAPTGFELWYDADRRMNLRELSDAELLQRVAEDDSDVEVRAAQAAFYERHVRYLYGVLFKRCASILTGRGYGVEDLVQDTFQRAFAGAHTFKIEGPEELERTTARTRAWLGRIAQHILADQLAGDRSIAASDSLDSVAYEPPAASTPNPAVERMRAALEGLSEREQDVLRVTALYQKPGEAHQRLPNAVCSELARRWGMSSENVRAVRSRALKKLKAELESVSLEARP
jgi:RNA polymerase sigma factor (sigma-70 family)